MPTYMPTASELEELGFERNTAIFFLKEINTDTTLWYKKPTLSDSYFELSINNCYETCSTKIHPRSLSDLKTLIQIFTPPN